MIALVLSQSLSDEAAQGKVISHFIVAVVAVMNDQDSVGHRAALPGVSNRAVVRSLWQQRGYAHHLGASLLPLQFVLSRRQLGAKDYG